jgi:ATP-dependent DNA helicase RecG
VRPLFTETDLRALLQRDEGQFLEFKSLWELRPGARGLLDRRQVRDAIAEYVAAFANADGGTLVLGVEDSGTPTGHEYPPEAVQDFFAVPERRLRPPVAVDWQRATVDGNEVLVCQVGIAPQAVMVDGNGFPYRAADTVIREPQAVIDERKQAYRRVGFEQRIRPEASIADLDLELVRGLLAQSVHRDLDVETWLERYSLLVPRPAGWEVTNGALLLCARRLERWHPRAGIRFFRVEGRERRHGARRNVVQLERVDLPIATAIPEAYRIAASHIRRSERLHDLFFREMPEYPTFAWQEAVVNAVAHRDYADQGREVEVWFYEDRLEVLSPGDLVPPVTIEALRARRPVHASRNPLLVRVLVEAGIMREEGEGVPRIFEEMEESLLRPPEFEVSDATFRVTLHNEPIFVGPGVEWQRLVNQLAISTAQRRVLLAHPGGFTNEDYRKLNQVDRDQAYREIQELVARGILVPPEASGRGAVYHLSPDLHQARAWLESRVPELREHFKATEVFTNSDFRQLFRVTRYVATRELRQLVQAGYLELVGERRGARYLPGPALKASGRE